jgi:hypothetical protein
MVIVILEVDGILGTKEKTLPALHRGGQLSIFGGNFVLRCIILDSQYSVRCLQFKGCPLLGACMVINAL